MLRPAGALAAMGRAYAMAGVAPADVDVAEVHDCFSVMGAIGVEVLGLAGAGEGARFWRDGRAAVDGDCGDQPVGRPDRQGAPDRRHRRRHGRLGLPPAARACPPPLQRQDAEVAATFNIGGPICATVATVLTRE